MRPLDESALMAIGMPIAPGSRRLLRGEEALDLAAELLASPGIEPEMGAAWVSALEADFPSLHRLRRWPVFEVEDRDRFVKLRRLVRQHLAKMF